MHTQQMLEISQELEKELRENKKLEHHQKQTIEALIEEINRHVNAPEVKMNSDQYFIQKLKDETEHFETDHPKLTRIIGRVSDLLARMGI